MRLARVAKLRSEKGRPDLPLLSVFLGRGVIGYPSDGGQVHKPGLDLSTYQIVRRGDFVLNNQQAWRGSVGVSSLEGIISPAYIVFQLEATLNPDFANYLFQSHDMVAQYVTASKGVGDIQRDVHIPWLRNIKVPIPSNAEQTVISRFLDAADARVQRAIRAKRRVIDLLNEEKQAIVDAALTNAEGRLVWRRTRLKYEAEVQTGVTLGKRYVGETLHAYPYLRVANVQSGYLDLSVVKTVQVPSSEATASRLAVGDVLMTEGGDIDKLGRGCVWRGEVPGCLHQNHIFVVRTASRLLPEFLVLAMISAKGRHYFQSTAKQTTNLASTNQTTIRNLSLQLPSIENQRRMVSEVTAKSEHTEQRIRRTANEIELLREYRVRLVADVVTGKLDVRAVQLAEVEADKETESLDETEQENIEGDEELVGITEGEDAGD